jgi:hypothetical protein
MNGRPLTDAQISLALRAHLPDRAQSGLGSRILELAEATPQQRALPSFLGALSEADPVSRRRSLLIAAALLVALALASAAAVGALRLLQRDPVPDLSIEPPVDVPAFVLSSYERLPQLPPLAMTWRDSDSSDKGRIYVDRSGAVRFDRFASADATEPSSYTILSGSRISGMAPVESEAVWVEPGHEAFGDDPRVFIRTVLNSEEGPGCEMERDQSEVGDGTAATGWSYVGVEYVAGRPTHHFACVGEIWLDVETRLILRTQAPLTDDSGQPIPGQFGTREVTEIAFGEQPAALFEAPEGVAHMTSEAYSAYLCTRDVRTEVEVGLGVRDCAAAESEATPLPTSTPAPTVRPSPSDCAVPSRDPSDSIGPLAWTEASLKEDWPAPVRSEPAGGANVQPMPLTHIDPTGDAGSDVLPCADIRDLTISTYGVGIDLVSNQPPGVDPTELWIAYGVVLDDDRDGVPDWRYGIDNLPRTAGGEEREHRAWRTDLHTGRTERLAGPGFDYVGDTFFESDYLTGGSVGDAFRSGADARFKFGWSGDLTGGGRGTRGIELDMPLYAWASVIQNGRVVATDYAPDAGWLLPSPGAKPGGTYVLDDPFPLRLTMSVADGWDLYGGDPHAGGVIRGSGDSGETGILFVIVDNPVKDPCDSPAATTDPPLGPSVEDLVTLLAGLPVIDISEKRDVTLDGYSGTYLEFTKNTGNEYGCAGMDGWPTNTGTDVDEHNQVWILDVDGVRLVIDAFSTSASESVRVELRRIVESIQIEP